MYEIPEYLLCSRATEIHPESAFVTWEIPECFLNVTRIQSSEMNLPTILNTAY